MTLSCDLGWHGNHLDRNYVLPKYIKWNGAVLIKAAPHIVIHHWTAGVFSILLMCVELWYLVYCDHYGQFDCQYSHRHIMSSKVVPMPNKIHF